MAGTKKKAKKSAPKKQEPELEIEQEQEQEVQTEQPAEAQVEEDEESSEEEYSDLDEDAKAGFANEEDVIPLSKQKLAELEPIVSKTMQQIKQSKAPLDGENRGVIYLGHIPYGFFEEQMRGFFTQFGEVTRLRLARNVRGKSKHYAYVEFRNDEVARIVADTMHGYMMYERTLVCRYVEPEDLHKDTFNNSERKFRQIPWRKLNRISHNRPRDAQEQKKRVKSLVKKESKRRKKLKECGIEYDFPGYKAQIQAAPKRKRFD